MSKHLDNLKRISKKLGVRYGTDDDLVQQLQKAIEVQEIKKAEKLERRKNKPEPRQRSGVVSNATALRGK